MRRHNYHEEPERNVEGDGSTKSAATKPAHITQLSMQTAHSRKASMTEAAAWAALAPAGAGANAGKLSNEEASDPAAELAAGGVSMVGRKTKGPKSSARYKTPGRTQQRHKSAQRTVQRRATREGEASRAVASGRNKSALKADTNAREGSTIPYEET